MTTNSTRLEEYERKRDFNRTAEPRGDEIWGEGDEPRFVIQHHAASSEHYDFRLEVNGALASWAVPKGPSTDPRVKRLAVRTEDHPIGYMDFEGTIPEDEYGGGSVIVWDAGTWENHTTRSSGDDLVPAEDALAEGHLNFWIDGHKLHGGYTLQQLKGRGADWLLIKRKDDGADARRRPTSTEPESVISGDTVEDVSARTADEEGGRSGATRNRDRP